MMLLEFICDLSIYESREAFSKAQRMIALKTSVAIETGYKLIRIDHTQFEHVEQHLENALIDTDPYYFSTRSMYEWLSTIQYSDEFLAQEGVVFPH